MRIERWFSGVCPRLARDASVQLWSASVGVRLYGSVPARGRLRGSELRRHYAHFGRYGLGLPTAELYVRGAVNVAGGCVAHRRLSRKWFTH